MHKPYYGKVSLTCPRDLEPGLINSDAGRGCGLSRGHNDASARTFASTVIAVTHSRIKVHGIP
jgi:hypothetical protein